MRAVSALQLLQSVRAQSLCYPNTSAGKAHRHIDMQTFR
jgi:hypothetical protein